MTTLSKSIVLITAAIDAGLLAFVFAFTPLSHITNVPFYFAEPMRIAVFLSIILLNKKNSYLMAFILPIFSFLVNGHPPVLKAAVMSLELVSNVGLYYFFHNYFKRQYLSVALSIIVSKLFYYILKYFLWEAGLELTFSFFATPFQYQLIPVLTVLIIFALNRKLNPNVGKS